MGKLQTLTLIFMLFLCTIVGAQEQFEVVRAPERTQITNRIHILVDISNSMSADEMAIAVQHAINISGQPTDELEIAISAFGDGYRRMSASDAESDVGPNWMSMPSQEHLDAIGGFLNTHGIGRSWTRVAGALNAAIDEDVENLCVIIISDLKFLDMDDFRQIDTEVPIGLLGIGADIEDVTILSICDDRGYWFMNVPTEGGFDPWK